MWRPKNWKQPNGIGNKTPEMAFESGADAILEVIWKMAEESPTKTFTFDKRHYLVYCEEEK